MYSVLVTRLIIKEGFGRDQIFRELYSNLLHYRAWHTRHEESREAWKGHGNIGKMTRKHEADVVERPVILSSNEPAFQQKHTVFPHNSSELRYM